VKLGGWSIYVLHNLNELGLDPTAAGTDVIVSGHSHQPKIETIGSVVYLNREAPGHAVSACPLRLRRLSLSATRFDRAFMK
jgi:predicted phosphodiesterase